MKNLLKKIRKLLGKAREWDRHKEGPYELPRYTGVPVWKPWRDF
ncbi:MAG TPA: hypothetical protein VII25_05785 [Candidatus Acidoferrum sp.]|jgi:hypothetical protein